ncbi:putative glutaredoxin-C14 [Cinnamomum micranthum f. kanehirae]|uniref:Putative glutaredoxin-C14 n=1 Tax=Cinnamomum micranthum f. kanehirae TaxID=337451 RepID=A0A443PTN3_9MAGN|nr:putative glutaredoxin-C14 [Cinnamomum micranthum f. kanehirae]
MDTVLRLASQNAVVIFSSSSCCMCHTIKTLFYDLGVSPAIYELDQIQRGRDMEMELASLLGRNRAVPAVFIGQQLVGSTDEVMSLHLRGTLIDLLKRAGAIWV